MKTRRTSRKAVGLSSLLIAVMASVHETRGDSVAQGAAAPGHGLQESGVAINAETPVQAAGRLQSSSAFNVKKLEANSFPKILSYRAKKLLPLDLLKSAVVGARLEAQRDGRFCLFYTGDGCFARKALIKAEIDDKLRMYRSPLLDDREEVSSELHALEKEQADKLTKALAHPEPHKDFKDPPIVRALGEAIASTKKKLADIDKKLARLPTSVEECSATAFIKELGTMGEKSYHTAAKFYTSKGPLVFDPYVKSPTEVHQGLLLSTLADWITQQKFNDPMFTLAPASFISPLDFQADAKTSYAGWRPFEGKTPADPVYRAQRKRSLNPAKVMHMDNKAEKAVAESQCRTNWEPIDPQKIEENVKMYLNKLPERSR